eukprot:TRINITY_DN18317_c0_g1_i1.p1 TRINITY_DN18317_c0_g1~~TRINITY_DN18317_c0_g1_i1.p1  ORF type:complete len:377 (+),score=72.53 TRINITY_DN18317_c0_g1_i1:187-1317(+)
MSANGGARLGDELFPRSAFGNLIAERRRNSRRQSHAEIITPGVEGGGADKTSSTEPKAPEVANDAPSECESTFSDVEAQPASPSGVRRNSQRSFAEKQHTMLILDWDDTIFPTTWVRNDCGMNWKLPIDEQLDSGPRKSLIKELLAKLLVRVEDFFGEALVRTNVLIVTLARRPWVEMSTNNFLPGLSRHIATGNVKIIYAQEYVTSEEVQDYQRDEFLSSDETRDFWTRVKGEAISKELHLLHERNNASWKNIISLGDSDFERFGTMAASQDYMRREMQGGATLATGATSEGISRDGHLKRLRTKTVKMLSEPTIEELTAELALLKRWLPFMVKQDNGFDVELDSTEDNDQLRELHKMITGEDAELSWEELAGME